MQKTLHGAAPPPHLQVAQSAFCLLHWSMQSARGGPQREMCHSAGMQGGSVSGTCGSRATASWQRPPVPASAAIASFVWSKEVSGRENRRGVHLGQQLVLEGSSHVLSVCCWPQAGGT